MNEFALIEAYFKRLGEIPKAFMPDLGIGDDCALVSVPAGKQLAISTDTLIENVHFPIETSARDIGFKALAVNLSDLAAMGATPAWFTLCISLNGQSQDWVAEFCAGLADLMALFPIALIGGDTTKGPLSITVQVMGLVDHGCALTRSGARIGDDIYVSGCIGEAAVGLSVVQNTAPQAWAQVMDLQHAVMRLNRPSPRVSLGAALIGMANACIDVSDGLLADLNHILERSGVGACLNINAIPIAAALTPDVALVAGDDYELCFTAHPNQRENIQRLAQRLQLPLTVIGHITQQQGVSDLHGTLVSPTGYTHF